MTTDTTETTAAWQPDVAALEGYMREHIPGFKGPLSLKALTGGASNPTFRIVAADRSYVMRAKPGPSARLLPSAHAIDREYRIMSALRGSEVPVPETFCLCQDEAVLGREFMVMGCVEGRVFWDQALPDMQPPERAAIYDEMNRVLAALHRVDYAAIGLADYGRPGNYFTRQIARWSRQYQATETEKIAAMDRLMAWLPEHVPAGEETSLVHGDFRLDNMIFHPIEPRVLALLDWELSTLGHPLADLSYQCMAWHIPPSVFRGIGGLDLPRLGIPSEQEYVAAYCRRTGRERIAAWDFYLAYNLFRMAGIMQGVKKRALDGMGSSVLSAHEHQSVAALAEIGWGFAQRFDAEGR